MKRLTFALVALAAVAVPATARAQWSYPTPVPLRFQINGGAFQTPVTVINAPAGSSLSAGVLTLNGNGTPSSGSSPFTIGTNLVLSQTGLTAPRTFTFPDATDTVCGIGATQTLLNKTLTAPVINGLTSSGSTAIDFSGNSGPFKFPAGNITGAGISMQLASNANYGCNGNCSFGNNASDGSLTIGKSTTLQVYAGTPRTGRVTIADAAYSMVAGNYRVAYTSITATRIVTLIPQVNCSSGTPCEWEVVNESASAQTITIQASAGNVNGAASVTCTSVANGFCRGYCNGTNCFMTANR